MGRASLWLRNKITITRNAMDARTLANRWPHTCKIYEKSVSPYQTDISAAFSTEEETPSENVVYEGKCYKYGASTMRTFKTDGVIKADFAVDIPELIKGVKGGFLIDVYDDCGEYLEMEISDLQPVRYGKFVGTTLYFNYAHQ